MAKKRKSSFKKLPKRAKKAAFAAMTASGKIRPKNKQERRTGGGSLGLSFGTRRQIFNLAKETHTTSTGAQNLKVDIGEATHKKRAQFFNASISRIDKRLRNKKGRRPAVEQFLSPSDRTALKRGSRGSSWRN